MNNFASGTRMTRGMEIVHANGISENADGTFSVPSQTGGGSVYRVESVRENWVCNCPDFEYRHITCKHVYAVQFSIALKQYILPQRAQVVSEDAITCKFCQSIRVIRYGSKSGKQQFRCKDCRRAFVEDSPFKKLKYDPELITITLDLYFKGISLRKISDHLSQMYGVEINFSTVYKWIDKYVSRMDDYVKTLAPKLSGHWHVDEMAIKVKGGGSIKTAEGQYKWLWNVLDKESRFQLASEISQTKNELDSMRVLKEALSMSKQVPQIITTDKMGSYPMGIDRAFIREQVKPIHHRVLGGAGQKDGNQLAERLHNTIRERNKVQRGWKKDGTPLKKGQMLYYNFVRPHMTLKGKTPAEVAGIGVEGENRWMELLRRATANGIT